MYGCPETLPKNSKSISSCWLPVDESCTNFMDDVFGQQHCNLIKLTDLKSNYCTIELT